MRLEKEYRENKFITNKKEYFIALLTIYCKKRHKQSEGEVFCYYCEEFFYLLEDNDFDPSGLELKDKAKYNRIINSANLWFKIKHLIPYLKYHKLFPLVDIKNE